MSTTKTAPTRRGAWAVMWLPGLFVALGAGVATAHGLFEVAVAAGLPPGLAWLYPLITDGLALVAYGATTRLDGAGRRYAWTVVVLAAGLSGLAQAVYLVGGVRDSAGLALRFGVGAWPAIAAAIVAHLLFLLGHTTHRRTRAAEPDGGAHRTPSTDPVQPTPDVQPDTEHAVQPSRHNAGHAAVQPQDGLNSERSVSTSTPPAATRPTEPAAEQQPAPVSAAAVQSITEAGGGGSARDRARAAARRHLARHGEAPTVRQLSDLAQVSTGTAGTALKELREQSPTLHIVHNQDPPSAEQ